MGRQLTHAPPSSPAARAYRETPVPEPPVPWRQADFAVIDFETTGLNPSADEIVSFATIPIEDGRIRIAGSRYQLVRPRRMPDGESIRIHGLRPADLEDAPTFEQALDDLLEGITGRVLIAHVAAVERGFLGAALSHHGLELRNPIVDTAALAAELAQRRNGLELGRPPAGLTELARAFRLPVHRPHHADGDALTTAQVFLALATYLDESRPLSVEEMAELRYASPRRSLWERLRRARRDLIRSSARP